MNQKIIQFYLIAHRLKEKIRTGWQEVEISGERLESVAEHIYGCLMLAIAIDSEYVLELDMLRVLKMIALHELEETIMKDFTIRDGISKEEKIALGRKCVIEATDGLCKQDEMVQLLDEFNAHETKESRFCFHIDKIECDFQAKLYDLQGKFDMTKALEDIQFYGEEGLAIQKKAKNASDVWIEYDKKLYEDDTLFQNLIMDIQNLNR